MRIVLSIATAIIVLSCAASAGAQGADLTQDQIDSMISFASEKKWAALAGLVIFVLMRFAKSDVKPAWLNVPPRARVFAAWGLSVAYLVIDKVAEGVPWRTAVANMTTQIVVSVVLLHDTWIAAIRGGKELPVPGLTIPGARPSPTAPATVTPPNPAPVLVPGTGDADAIASSVEKQAAQDVDRLKGG